jgi:hypothetical protein
MCSQPQPSSKLPTDLICKWLCFCVAQILFVDWR